MAYGKKAVGPSGSALIEQMRGKLGDWPHGLTVLTGDDAYHLDQAQRPRPPTPIRTRSETWNR